jgi:O-antigen ligase
MKNKLNNLIRDQAFLTNYFVSAMFLTIILISFSRSFWVGMIAGVLTVMIMIITVGRKNLTNSKTTINNLLKTGTILFLLLLSSLIIIFCLVKFPYPKPVGGFDTTNLFSERATQTDESAIGSRWALLPILWSKISDAPIQGKGFGTTVTYKSQDPRVLMLNTGGTYTTYAFEWGWLDIWLKLGIIGLLSYLFLLARISFYAFKAPASDDQRYLKYGLLTGLIILTVVNFFSPYLNHPLGLGLVIMIYSMLIIPVENNKKI